MSKYKAPLGTGHANKECAPFFVGFAPKSLILDAKNDDRVELQALALVDGQNANGLIVRKPLKSLRQIGFDLE